MANYRWNKQVKTAPEKEGWSTRGTMDYPAEGGKKSGMGGYNSTKTKSAYVKAGKASTSMTMKPTGYKPV